MSAVHFCVPSSVTFQRIQIVSELNRMQSQISKIICTVSLKMTIDSNYDNPTSKALGYTWVHVFDKFNALILFCKTLVFFFSEGSYSHVESPQRRINTSKNLEAENVSASRTGRTGRWRCPRRVHMLLLLQDVGNFKELCVRGRERRNLFCFVLFFSPFFSSVPCY